MARKPNAAPPQLDLGDDVGNADDTGITIENEADANLADANGHDKDESTVSMEEQLEALRRRAENAEAEAASLRQHTAKQGEDLQTTRVAAVDRAIDAANAERADLRRQIVEAKQAGNYETETDLLDKLTTVNLRLNQLNVGKSALEREIEEIKNTPSDPVEAYTKNMKPEARAWVMRHPEMVTDPAKNRELERTHYKALGEGLAGGTPEYFEFLDEQLGFSGRRAEPQIERSETRSRASETQGRNNTDYSAPPSRSSSSASTRLPAGVTRNSNGTYRLSRELHEAAQISGQTDKEYLDNLLALQREGRIVN